MLRDLVSKIEASGYECEAGPLENNIAWQELRRIAAIPGDWDIYFEQVMADIESSDSLETKCAIAFRATDYVLNVQSGEYANRRCRDLLHYMLVMCGAESE